MVAIIKGLLSKALDCIPQIKGGSIKIIIGLSFVYALLVILFLAGWVYNWRAENKADLKIMIELIQVLTGPAAIAAFSFLGKGFIDKNKNGVPDELEDNK